MSEFRTIRDALWESPIPTTAKMVALRLVEHLPCVRPSIAGLAERTGLSERAVQYALRELERNGIIVAEQRQGQPSIYRFRGMGPIELFQWGGAPDAPVQPVHPGGATTAPPGGAPDAPEADKSQADKISGRRVRSTPPSLPKKRWRVVPASWAPNEAHRARVNHWPQSRFLTEVQKFREWEFKQDRTDADLAFFRWLRTAETDSQSARATTMYDDAPFYKDPAR